MEVALHFNVESSEFRNSWACDTSKWALSSESETSRYLRKGR